MFGKAIDVKNTLTITKTNSECEKAANVTADPSTPDASKRFVAASSDGVVEIKGLGT